MKDGVTNNSTLISRRVTQSSFFFLSFQRKCDQYWPERGTRNYGQVQVTLKETLNMSHYTVRKLVMTHKMVSCGLLTILRSRRGSNSPIKRCRANTVHANTTH